MKKCSECGQEYEDKFNFCRKCGTKLDSVESKKIDEPKPSNRFQSLYRIA